MSCPIDTSAFAVQRPQSTMEAGWPRPWRELDEAAVRAYENRPAPERVPVPWMNAGSEDDQRVDWVMCRADCSLAHTNRLCQVCGEPLGKRLLLPRTYRDRFVSGSGTHPRCMALTLSYCPHFSSSPDAVVAYLYEGDGVGYIAYGDHDPEDVYVDTHPVDPSAVAVTRADIKRLAVADPMGQLPA